MSSKRFYILSLVLVLLIALIAVGIVEAATPYDLTTSGSTATINGAIFEAFNPTDPTGSGIFDPFVRISSNLQVIKGYNTDYRPLQYQENSSPTFTRAQLLSAVPQVKVDGVWYREFQLDINQNKTNDDYLESLDTVELYESPYIDLCGYPFDGSGVHAGCLSHNTASMVWDMDGAGDAFVILDYRNNEGSGKRDMKLLVPDGLFNQNSACDYAAAGCTVYLTIYSQFGGDEVCPRADPNVTTCGNNDGFEEWGVRAPEATAITLQDISAADARSGAGPVIIAAGLFAMGAGLILILRERLLSSYRTSPDELRSNKHWR